MTPHNEDPNNHVPAVTPDDDWDGVDVEQVFNAQLPPRRTDTPRMPKMDVNLSGFTSIEPVRASGTSNVMNEDGSAKPSVSVNIHAERVAVEEKEEFQPALAMEDMKLDEAAAKVIQRPIVPSRFKQGERDDWGVAQKKGSARWMFYTASGVILLIALTVSLSYLDQKKSIKISNNNTTNLATPVAQTDDTDVELDALGQLTNSKKEALRIYAKYAQAKSANDLSEWVYLSDENTPLLAKSWNPLGADEKWMPADSTGWKVQRNGEQIIGELKGVNHNFSKFNAVFRYEKTAVKIDWKATSGYGSADFKDLETGQGDGSEIRGWITPSDFYTKQLPDDKYRSFIVRSPDNKNSIWAYTEIGSGMDKEILELYAISPITGEYQTEAKVILRLERGENEILPRQWMIKKLIARNWLDQAKP